MKPQYTRLQDEAAVLADKSCYRPDASNSPPGAAAHSSAAPASSLKEDGASKQRAPTTAADDNRSSRPLLDEPPTIKGYISRRAIISLLICWSTFSMYIVRVNISDSILDMGDEFGWSSTERGLILSSFFIGYAVGQIPGGLLSMRYGGKNVLLFSVVWAMAFTFLSPIAAKTSVQLLIACRAIMGFGESFSYPALIGVLTSWIPPKERSVFSSIAYSGAYLGTIFSLFVTPFTMRYMNGWPASFYLYGGNAAVWSVVWWFYGSSTPREHRSIHPDEVRYINFSVSNARQTDTNRATTGQNNRQQVHPTHPSSSHHHFASADFARAPTSGYDSNADATPDAEADEYGSPERGMNYGTGGSMGKHTLPAASAPPVMTWPVWRFFLSRAVVWAVIVQNFCINWLLYVLISWLPEYFKRRWGVDVQADAFKTGYMSALPFCFWLLASMIGSNIADHLILSKHYPRLIVRKFAQAFALTASSVFLIILAFCAKTEVLSEVFISTAVALSATHTSGYVPTVMDIGGDYASLIIALSNTAGTLPGIVGVFITGVILDHTDDNWAIVFLLAAGINLFGLLVWLRYASVDRLEVPSELLTPLIAEYDTGSKTDLLSRNVMDGSDDPASAAAAALIFVSSSSRSEPISARARSSTASNATVTDVAAATVSPRGSRFSHSPTNEHRIPNQPSSHATSSLAAVSTARAQELNNVGSDEHFDATRDRANDSHPSQFSGYDGESDTGQL